MNRRATEAMVVCYPTDMVVAQPIADALGVPLRASEMLAANGRFFVLDPLGELDHAEVLRLQKLFEAGRG